MAFTIHDLQQRSNDPIMYDRNFRTVIETHLPFIKTLPNTRFIEITPDLVHQFEADFCGFLNEQSVPLELHWIYTRINGMYSPTEFGIEIYNQYDGTVPNRILLPAPEVISTLRGRFISTRR